jgi:predicted phage terminase large subunit-like protein
MKHEEKLVHAAMREDFSLFTRRAFMTVSPGVELIWGLHLDALAWVLNECIKGNIKRLVITLPPRYMKSIFASVALPAFILGKNPEGQIICASYADGLSLKHAADTRLVMETAWYRKAFPETAQNLSQVTQHKIMTAKNGFRLATTVGGSLTGLGCDILIIDDPHKADEANSDTKRTSTTDWFSQTAVSRLNNKKEGIIIVIQQRLHQADLAGILIELDGWHHLNLPATAEKDEDIPIGPGKFFHRKAGDALHPERESLDDLKTREIEMGDYAFAAQYQQRPSPLGGGIIKLDWFQTYHKLKHPMHAEHIVQAWDSAVTAGEKSDYTVCITAYAISGKLFIKDILRVKVEFPELKDLIFNHAAKHQARVVLIEAVGAGKALYQQVQTQRLKMNPWPFELLSHEPKSDKATRLLGVSPVVGEGRVYLPVSAPWLEPFQNEIMNFPNGVHDDQVDAFSMLLYWAQRRYLPQFQ